MAAFARFKPSNLARRRAGERSLFVPEEFAFDQGRVNAAQLTFTSGRSRRVLAL